MADFSQMSDEQLAGCVSSAESGEAVAEMVSRYTGLVLALALNPLIEFLVRKGASAGSLRCASATA